MPATEKTWRQMRLLHRVFAVSSLLMLGTTILWYAKDHADQWKRYQLTARNVNLKLTAWRQLQFATDQTVRDRQALQIRLLEIQSQPIAQDQTKTFVEVVQADAKNRGTKPLSLNGVTSAAKSFNAKATQVAEGPVADFQEKLDNYLKVRIQLDDAKAALSQVQKTNDAPSVDKANQKIVGLKEDFQKAGKELKAARVARETSWREVSQLRPAVIDAMKKHANLARFREDSALREKQFKTADFDAARADVGLGVRDHRPPSVMRQLQATASQRRAELQILELKYQTAQDVRKDLEAVMTAISEQEAAVEKQLADNQANIEDINRQIEGQRSTYFVNGFLPGKRWLELPILDAFNSPLQIKNLWADDLEIQIGSFSRNRRFDRCTTCHTAIDKTMPGTADVPAFEHGQTVDFVLSFGDDTATESELQQADPDAEELSSLLAGVESTDVPKEDQQLRSSVGLILADTGLIANREVTVQFVQPKSPAARARFDLGAGNRWQVTAEALRSFPVEPHREVRPAEIVILPEAFPTSSDLRLGLRSNNGDTLVSWKTDTEITDALESLQAVEETLGFVAAIEGESLVIRSRQVGTDAFVSVSPEGEMAADFKNAMSATASFGVNLRAPRVVPGLKVGDVLLEINGDPVKNRNWALQRLLNAADAGESLQLRVRRGLPHPYATHPRLDLFVGTMSPHAMSDFACTICHDGQGSATEFKWASHTPDSASQKESWSRKLGWFDNHHWVFPMQSKRFVESSCVRCHHDVTELEPSLRFPEPPAPKLMRGYHLIRKYGCYGCHEVNGFAGPGKRQGPDMRLEPNFFAAAQEFQGQPGSGYAKLSNEERAWVEALIAHPEDDATRHRISEMISVDATLAGEDAVDENETPARFSKTVHKKIASLLNDVDSPGQLRRPGPALRFVAQKVGKEFLFDWIDNPQRYRPSTRMPRFFGNTNHLEGASLDKANAYGPIEVAGIVEYLLHYSQPFEYLNPPEGIAPVTSAEDRQQQLARGKIEFERCLACHTHSDFPDTVNFRSEEEIVQGPDLSRLGAKFNQEKGRRWLYSWVKQPMRYHVRTVMPELFLDPVIQKDIEGNVLEVTDPAADLVAYLLSGTSGTYQPKPYAMDDKNLKAIALENLKDRFHWSKAETYLAEGIPQAHAKGLKGAEIEMVVTDQERDATDFESLLRTKRLRYVGSKAIAKYGCFGCHDIVGFEDAKPIGTGLADWGVKETSKLAFEHIGEYLDHGQSSHDDSAKPHAGQASDAAGGHGVKGPREMPPEFFRSQIQSHNRIGFLYQKLNEPRSYDYHSAINKGYNEWLRMPQFPFSDAEREAVMTFVLGLIADPPRAKYVYDPPPKQEAILAGKKVLEKYNCGGCHLLKAERWELAYPPGTFEAQSLKPTYPFIGHSSSAEEILKSAQTDYQNLHRTAVDVMPLLGGDGRPSVLDEEFEQVETGYTYDPRKATYHMQLYAPAILGGFQYQISDTTIEIPANTIEKRHAATGGFLTKYLLPNVVARELQKNPQAKGTEAWAWLPPPLIGEGRKVQTNWLHDFLLDPHMIRPGVVFRMPRFNMTSGEATALANYFAAIDGAEFPYTFRAEQRSDHLRDAEKRYAQKLRNLAAPDHAAIDSDLQGRHLDDAMKIVVDKNYCRQCHIVADYVPVQSLRAMGPDLTRVQNRLRPSFLRQWIGKPTSVLPYSAMPVNVPYDPDDPELDPEQLGSTVPRLLNRTWRQLYHGNSIEQLDALVDLLMNYDSYAKQHAKIAPLVPPTPPPEPVTTSSQ